MAKKETKSPQLPKYVSLKGVAMRLTPQENQYYRHAGEWGVYYKVVDGKVFSKCPYLPWIHNVELIPITEEQWKIDNQGYLPNDKIITIE
jgi:hypothetical protein